MTSKLTYTDSIQNRRPHMSPEVHQSGGVQADGQDDVLDLLAAVLVVDLQRGRRGRYELGIESTHRVWKYEFVARACWRLIYRFRLL